MKCFIYVFLYSYIIGNIEAFLRLTFLTNDPNSYAFCKPKYFSKQELLKKLYIKENDSALKQQSIKKSIFMYLLLLIDK